MHPLEHIRDKARALSRRIVLPEGEDARILQAAARATSDRIAQVTLLGDAARIARAADDAKADLRGVEILDPQTQTSRAAQLKQLRKYKNLTPQQASDASLQPLNFAALMLASGDAHGCVAGARHTTSDVLRAALQIVGAKSEGALVSSFFLMRHHLAHQAVQGAALYADCAMLVDPDAEQLANIALDTADNAERMLGLKPKVALLSFSTAGSARHAKVNKVIQAGDLIKQRRPQLELLVEAQFDAAVVGDILRAKAPHAKFNAPANVFIFPDLQSANIGYKIAERIGGVEATGPILQGLARPMNDLSRGCNADDVCNLIAVTAAQAA